MNNTKTFGSWTSWSPASLGKKKWSVEAKLSPMMDFISVATVHGDGKFAKDNANLIAAAPKMLEALKEVSGMAWSLDDIPPNELTNSRLHKMLKDIGMFTEDIIDKAEGK